MEGHPVSEVFHVQILVDQVVRRDGIVVDGLQKLDQLGMVVISLAFQDCIEGGLIVMRVVDRNNHILIAVKFAEIDLVKMAVGIQSVSFHAALV